MSHKFLGPEPDMTQLTIFLNIAVVGLVASSSCTTKEFTETPAEVENPCEGHFYYDYFYPDDEDSFFLHQWRGELRYTSDEAYIYIEWKKLVHDPRCVHTIEFFVNGVREDAWEEQNETAIINNLGEFSLRVEVFYRFWGGSSSCGGLGDEDACECFEATTNLEVLVGDDHCANAPPLVAGGFAGGDISLLNWTKISSYNQLL